MEAPPIDADHYPCVWKQRLVFLKGTHVFVSDICQYWDDVGEEGGGRYTWSLPFDLATTATTATIAYGGVGEVVVLSF
jgi:hypothetical protein